MLPGIATLLSALAGAFGGSLPKIFDFFFTRLSYSQELKIRELEFKYREQEHRMQLELADRNLSAKIQESYYAAAAEEVKANAAMTLEAMQEWSKPTGYAILDTLNAAIRPVFFVSTLSLFCCMVVSLVWADPTLFASRMAELFSFAVEGVLGWVVGYRAAIKPPAK